ncbi:hypothetical protein BH23GEM3_BH23GEM3_18640 [soil metagenome]|nr:D-glycero-beta-D-manno-heptose-7-phosphate kinase [Gemmatimonadota bacterium]
MTELSPDRLDNILERATAVRVAMLGDLMLDIYLIGEVSRISPEAPVPVVHVLEERAALGGAANVASNVVALGASCDVLGCVGRDAAGMEIQRLFAAHEAGRIRAHLVERADRPTTTKTRVMARKQQMVRFDREHDADLPDDCVEELLANIERVVSRADALVLEDYNKGVLVHRVIRAALAAAAAAGIPSVVDPKFRRFFEYKGATVFKPNVLELSTALGAPIAPENSAQLEGARRRIGCEHLLVTLGDKGMVLKSKGAASGRIPALAREVYDVSGAGDTVTACVAVALAAGATVREAATLANYAAAIGVTKPGVATVAPSELRNIVNEMPLAGLPPS